MSTNDSRWQPPAEGEGEGSTSSVPRYGDYGQAPAGRPTDAGAAAGRPEPRFGAYAPQPEGSAQGQSGPASDRAQWGPPSAGLPAYPEAGGGTGAGSYAGAGQYGQDHYSQGQYTQGQSGQGQYAAQAAAYPAGAGGGPAHAGAPPAWGPGLIMAPKPGIIPLCPLGIIEIISGAFESLRANPRAMFLPSLLVMGVTGLVSAILTYAGNRFSPAAAITDSTTGTTGVSITGSLGSVLPSLVTPVLNTIVTAVLTGLLIVAVSRAVLGRIASPSDVWERTRPRLLALVGQTLLITLMTSTAAIVLAGAGALILIGVLRGSSDGSNPSGGTLAAIVIVALLLIVAIGILSAFLAVRLALSPAALILENIGVWEGIRRSWQLTRGSFWRVLGILLTSFVITAVVLGVVGIPIGIISATVSALGASQLGLVAAASNFISALVSAVILPFTAAVTGLTYIDLRMRKEGLDVELRSAAGV